jgi:hypothetical protein
MKRFLPIKSKTCLSFLRSRYFQITQAHHFHKETPRKIRKKTNPYQVFLFIIIIPYQATYLNNSLAFDNQWELK